MSKRLDGKVALVTGGSRGIGGAVCKVFGREGAAVIVNYAKNADAAARVVSEIENGGGRAFAIQADVSQRQQVQAMVEKAGAKYGRIDVLVNNAGILFQGTAVGLVEDDLDRMIAVNLKGIIYCAQAVAPGMIDRRYGKVINLSSLAGLGTAVGGTTPYALTKAAVISFTKRLALELGPHGINVNAIAPGFIKTELLDAMDTGPVAKKAILGRAGVPEDVANAALFLASDESSFMTAQVLTIDGGRMDFLSHSA